MSHLQDHSLETPCLVEMGSRSPGRAVGALQVGWPPALPRAARKNRGGRSTDLFNQVFRGRLVKELNFVFNALLQKVYLAFTLGAWLSRPGLLLESGERTRWHQSSCQQVHAAPSLSKPRSFCGSWSCTTAFGRREGRGTLSWASSRASGPHGIWWAPPTGGAEGQSFAVDTERTQRRPTCSAAVGPQPAGLSDQGT